MVYILDELLNVTDDVVKEYYYDEIITTILDTGIADRFIKSLCELIQSLAIDKLHIIGDIYDKSRYYYGRAYENARCRYTVGQP